MSRLIIVPQFPAVMRYQELYINLFFNEFRKYFDSVVLVADKLYDDETISYKEDFSPIHKSIDFELDQIKLYLSLEINDDDFLLVNDISFPGFFTNALYFKKPKNCYAICHATSKNNLDFFSKVKHSKFTVETGYSKIYNKIFVATRYHAWKVYWDNIVVTGLPKLPYIHNTSKYLLLDIEKKKNKVINVSRITEQKVDLKLEKYLYDTTGIKVERPKKPFTRWSDYKDFLRNSICLLITSKEETFGYQVLDAVYNGCVVIAPNNFSYPELLPEDYLYNSKEEMVDKVEKVLAGELKCPEKLLNEDEINNFFKTIIKEMGVK